MNDLVTFLKARLDEDEQLAKRAKALDYNPWVRALRVPGIEAAFNARFDPLRMLAEVEAKRRILSEHCLVDPCDAHDETLRSVPCETLRLLALPYDEHPDYRAVMDF